MLSLACPVPWSGPTTRPPDGDRDGTFEEVDVLAKEGLVSEEEVPDISIEHTWYAQVIICRALITASPASCRHPLAASPIPLEYRPR
jgi:hypothetical protein